MKLLLQNLRQGLQTGRKKLSRRFLHWRMRGRPEAEVLAAERRLRGAEQEDKLRRADIVVVSFGKSGRTWLRVMLSHLFREMHDLPGECDSRLRQLPQPGRGGAEDILHPRQLHQGLHRAISRPSGPFTTSGWCCWRGIPGTSRSRSSSSGSSGSSPPRWRSTTTRRAPATSACSIS